MIGCDDNGRITRRRACVYLDLEEEDDRARLANPALYFADHEKELVILDGVHRVPVLFQRLRGIIDKGRRQENGDGRFLLLGSAAIDLLKQTGKTWRAVFLILNSGRLTRWKSAPRKLRSSGSGVDFHAAFWPRPTTLV